MNVNQDQSKATPNLAEEELNPLTPAMLKMLS